MTCMQTKIGISLKKPFKCFHFLCFIVYEDEELEEFHGSKNLTCTLDKIPGEFVCTKKKTTRCEGDRQS